MSLPRSLQPLAQIAMRETGAVGYKLSLAGQAWAFGEVGDCTLVSYPLRVDHAVPGTLSFAFRGQAIPPNARSILDRISELIEAVWRFSHTIEGYAARAARIGELELELADSKIADRARGLLANPGPGDGAALIARHVETVLRPNEFAATLERQVKTLEDEAAERAVAAQAKAILQSAHGMSEEQAHVYLRLTSRKNRKPLREVARELIEIGANG